MDPKHPHSQWAKLDAKAGETKHFAPCFLQVAKKMWHKSERPEDHRMIKALEAMVSFVALCDRSKMFFSRKRPRRVLSKKALSLNIVIKHCLKFC